MPDMSKPGSHLQSLLDEFEFKELDCLRASADMKLKAEVYQEAKYKLRIAIKKEAEIAALRGGPTV